MQIETFQQHRDYLFAIAYRMLGTASDADDVLQEAWLRSRAGDEALENPRGWLVTVVTRLCLDRLRELKRRREDYIGTWLPEPLLTRPETQPETRAELAESVSLAFLTLLETLNPVERAVFLLRQVFSYDYPEIAAVVEKSESNCRQLFHRAQQHVDARRPRFDASPEAQGRIVQAFVQAAGSGDMKAMLALLKDDVALYSDGGGKALAAINPLHGAQTVASFFIGLAARTPPDLRAETAVVNGHVALLLYEGAGITTVMILESEAGKITTIRVIRNPDKLSRVRSN